LSFPLHAKINPEVAVHLPRLNRVEVKNFQKCDKLQKFAQQCHEYLFACKVCWEACDIQEKCSSTSTQEKNVQAPQRLV